MKDDTSKLRDALRTMQPAAAHQAADSPAPNAVYAPSLHGNALRWDRPLVIGNRGVGKSFWASVLASDDARKAASALYGQADLRALRVVLGFHESAGKTLGPAPSSDQLVQLRAKGFTSRQIWTSVLLRAVAADELPTGLGELLAWSSTHIEESERLLRQADETLVSSGQRFLLVFDALDRLAPDWPTVRDLTTGLLQCALDARGYRAIRVKLFLRTDQAHDEALFRFPDASKLRSERVELVWKQCDLYGLMYQYLWHHPVAGAAFHSLVQKAWPGLTAGDQFPGRLRTDVETQTKAFAALAGEFMGSNPRRGRTYNWLHDHLADASGQTSPRSFQIALQRAAESVSPDAACALDHVAIKSGVQAASDVRVDQLKEDYPWIRLALSALEQLEVPVDRSVFLQRWVERETVRRICELAEQEPRSAPVEFAPPFTPNEEGILKALESIGVVEERSEARINVPDIFRVAAKLKRRGGVRVPAPRRS